MLTITARVVAAWLAALVHFGPSRTPAAPQVPWVQAGRVQGYLFYYSSFSKPQPGRALIYTGGRTPSGGATKILWYVPRGGLWLTVRGLRLDGPGTFSDRFRIVGNYFYPSVIDIPSVGCWRLTVASGGRRGRFAFVAIDAG